MRNFGWLVLVLLCAVGCNKTQKETIPERMPMLVEDGPLLAKPVVASAEEPEKKPPRPRGGSDLPLLGVPACDEYITKMYTCLLKMPAAYKDSAFEKSIEAWSKMEGPAREALAQVCAMASAVAKTAYKPMGCEF